MGSQPKVESVVQDEGEVDTDAEYPTMDIPCEWTLCQRMMPWEQYKEILWVHMAYGLEIMASKLQDMYTGL